MSLKDLVRKGPAPKFPARAFYPKEPRHLRATAWFYETPGGLEVVQELRDPKGDRYIDTATVVIPWRLVKAAVETRLRVEAQRRRKKL